MYLNWKSPTGADGDDGFQYSPLYAPMMEQTEVNFTPPMSCSSSQHDSLLAFSCEGWTKCLGPSSSPSMARMCLR